MRDEMGGAALFQKMTLPWGGRFPREQAPHGAKTYYAEIAERANGLIGAARRALPNLPPVHFDFIFNSRINAVAFQAKGQYFIGINTGTLYMLRTVIGRMLSDARLFPGIGDPTGEVRELEPFSKYSPDAEEMMRNSELLTPNDAIRGAYAWFLQDQAMMFFIGHELAHITRGHVDYVAKKGDGVTAELGLGIKRSKQTILERQCLEFDADRRSIVARIDSLRITFENPATPPLPWGPSAEGPGRLIQDWAVSLNILFRLFGDERFSRTVPAESSHPPLFLRRLMCEAIAISAVTNMWNPRFQSAVMTSLLSAEAEIGSAFAAILGPEFVQVTLPRTNNFSSWEQAEQLEELWESQMIHELREFSFES